MISFKSKFMDIRNRILTIVVIGIVTAYSQISFSKEVYRCEISGFVNYQGTPCKDKKTQKVACVNYAVRVDFKDETTDECHDSGLNNGSGAYGGYNTYSSSNSSYSSSSSGSSYSTGRAKNQHVSGYTRKDGTHVSSYNRSSKR